VQANVTKEESVTQAVDQIVAQAGALHGMVVNAGRTNHKAALDFSQDEIETLFSVNVCSRLPSFGLSFFLTHACAQLFGAFYCARAAARQFIKQKTHGAIVFTASMASYRPNKVTIYGGLRFFPFL
jgi:NAD(P)-dependent dehydrogenase (short-subunit alcohol dehydrogenase family)